MLLDVDVPVALMALHVAAEQSGFDVNSHHTVFSGRCPGCKSASPGRRGSPTATRAEWRRVDPAKRDNLELSIRFKEWARSPRMGGNTAR